MAHTGRVRLCRLECVAARSLLGEVRPESVLRGYNWEIKIRIGSPKVAIPLDRGGNFEES